MEPKLSDYKSELVEPRKFYRTRGVSWAVRWGVVLAALGLGLLLLAAVRSCVSAPRSADDQSSGIVVIIDKPVKFIEETRAR